MVICDHSYNCKMRNECGGAKPHNLGGECGTCKIHKNAKCVDENFRILNMHKFLSNKLDSYNIGVRISND